MIIFKHSADLKSYLHDLRDNNSIGFVPTMGALHEGHLALIKASRQDCNITVCSIFVNPLQFNNQQDFEKYPILIESDIELLEVNHCDILFLPSIEEIYPDDQSRSTDFALGDLENILESKFRPGHFQGVCKVVSRLLNIVSPPHLFLGQKDYQQTLVIKKMIGQLNLHIETVIVPTVREISGLAMSSRNMRLSDKEKEIASSLYKTLILLSNHILNGTMGDIAAELRQAKAGLEEIGCKVEYLEIANPETLQPISGNYQTENVIILVAAYVNAVRLIDNLLVSGD